MPHRRRVLRAGGIALLSGLAGCANDAPRSSADSETERPPQFGEETPTSAAVTPEGPPGADQLGGSDALQADVSVAARTLDADAGAGQFVFSPAIVWVESGTTVTWEIASGSHSVTAYHPENDQPLRIPEGADPFDSEILSGGSTFEHTFDTDGVYDYYCTPHEGLGMVGLVIVGGPTDGPGTTAPEEVGGQAASRLSRLLDVAGVA